MPTNFFPPAVNVKQTNLEIGSSVQFSSLFDVLDLDPGATATRYRFRDNSTYAPGGYFVLNNVRQTSGVWIEVDASQIAGLYYRSGLVISAESIGIQAFDGQFWSTASYGDVNTVAANVRQPIVSASNFSVTGFEGLAVDGLVSASDPDGYAITKFRFVDRSTNSTGGFFSFNGIAQTSGVWFEVPAAQLSLLRYIGGQVGESETIGIQAFDGALWSDELNIIATTIPNNSPPVVTAFDAKLKIDTTILATNMFQFSDPDGNSLKKVQFFDTGSLLTGGYFTINGVVQAANTWFEVDFNQLSSVEYHSASQTDFERFRVRAFDGRFWSANTSAKVETIDIPRFDANPETISIRELSITPFADFLVPDNGPAITNIEIIDLNGEAGSADLVLNGNAGTHLEWGELHRLTSAEFADLEILGGFENTATDDPGRKFDAIVYRAYNGFYWSDWQRLEVNTDITAIDALESGGDYAALSGKTVITFTFPEVVPFYYPDDAPERGSNAQELTPTIAAGVRRALAVYEDFLNVDFIEIPSVQGLGAFVFMRNDQSGSSGYAYLPPGPNTPGTSIGIPGDIWLNQNDPNIVEMNAIGFNTVLHEIGHALGLKHPFVDAINPPPGLPGSATPGVADGTDNDRYSIMSYTAVGLEVTTPMLYDLLNLMNWYGGNPNYNPEDTQIFIPQNFDDLGMIWDAGGYDSFNLGNQTVSVVADIREGRFSSIGGQVDNLAIAYGATIENLRGGSGDDTLRGNALGNIIIGGVGNDSLQGFAGTDTLRGDAGNDSYLYTYGDGFDTIDENRGAGRDTLIMNAFGDLNSFQQDIRFRRANNGLDLDIQLTVDGGEAQGGITIRNMGWGGSRIETLRFLDINGNIINPDVDLRSIYEQATNSLQSFRLTEFSTSFGVIAAPLV